MSSERSGSNLITKLFDSHPEFCGPAPTHMIRLIAQNYLNYSDFSDDKNWQVFILDIYNYLQYLLGDLHVSFELEELLNLIPRTTKRIIEYVYTKESQSQGKDYVFVKENRVFQFLPYLLSNFPESKYVYLVRDPRDVCLSFRKAKNIPVGLKSGLEIWLRDQTEFIKNYGFLKESDKIIYIKYEDLINDVQKQLNKVCEFLGVDYSPNMLNFYSSDIARLNADKWQEWQNLNKPLMINNFNKFKIELKPFEVKYIEQHSRKLMEFFQYKLEYDPHELVTDKELQLIDCNDEVTIKDKKEVGMSIKRKKRIEIINQVISRKLY